MTIVEWADFECPHCRHAAPLFEKAVETHPGKVRLVYKFFPLQAHVHGESAARGAVAAMKQGKFWEMHHTLFEHQDALEPRDIEELRQRIGARFRQVEDRLGVGGDRRPGEPQSQTRRRAHHQRHPHRLHQRARVRASKFDLAEDLDDWLNLEIELAGGATDKPAAIPPASASAKPAASGATTQTSAQTKK